MTERILVTGASGQLGGQICQNLYSMGIANVVPGSRTPEKLSVRFGPGKAGRYIDFDNEESLAHGLHDVGTLFIVSTDALAVRGHRIAQHRRVLQAAITAGVRSILYTSMPNPHHSAAIPFAEDHARMEEDLSASGLQFKVLRNSWYQENLLAYLPLIASTGVWYTSAGDGRISFVSRDDLAKASAALAVRSHDASGVFELAGPDSLSQEDIARSVEEVTGRPLRVEHASPERVRTELGRLGLPERLIDIVITTEANQRAGLFDVGAGSLGQFLDGRPTRLSAFLRRYADRFAADITSITSERTGSKTP
jgi:NAD(P)H dehydrogenase (quinone)